MSTARRAPVVAAFAAAALMATVRPAAAQTPPAAPPTGVLVNLTVKADADRSKLPGVMPTEVRDTVKLYLDGKIQQWWGRGDGRGVMFILNVPTAAAAKAIGADVHVLVAGQDCKPVAEAAAKLDGVN